MAGRRREKPIAWDKVARLLAKVALVTIAVSLGLAGGATAALGNERYTPIILGPTSPLEGRYVEGGISSGEIPPLGAMGNRATPQDHGNMSLDDDDAWALGPGDPAWHRFTFPLPDRGSGVLSVTVTWGGTSEGRKTLELWNFTSGAWGQGTSSGPGEQVLKVEVRHRLSDFVDGSGNFVFVVATEGGNATLATDFAHILIGRPGAFFVYLGTALFLAGVISVALAMILGLVSAPPRLFAMAPKGRGPTGMPSKDQLEPSREQFLFTIILFLLGILWLAMGYVVTLA